MNEQPRFRVGQTVRVWYLCGDPFNVTVASAWQQRNHWCYRLKDRSDWRDVDEPSLIELIEAAKRVGG